MDGVGSVTIDGAELVLAPTDDHDVEWIDFDACVQRLAAAWPRFSPKEPPLTPPVIGEPGVGKTTLACAVAHRPGRPPSIFQCTIDTLALRGLQAGTSGCGIVTPAVTGL